VKFPLVPKWTCLSPLITVVCSSGAFGFSLLAPYADWMQVSNGYRFPDDIGGPVAISEGYRWNVPVLTYGFDPSFLKHFGSSGVAAVEQAVQIINDLPPASSISLPDYPIYAMRVNYLATSQQLFDLESATLVLLVEQMGLAQPIRSIFTLRRWDPFFISNPVSPSWPPGTIPNYVVERNFDPETLLPSHTVNIGEQIGVVQGGYRAADAYEFQINPNEFVEAVAQRYLYAGYHWNGLTRDDVGGLRFLFSSNNIKYEILLPDVHGVTAADAHGHSKGKAHGRKNKTHKHVGTLTSHLTHGPEQQTGGIVQRPRRVQES
jgi:hypothetical protein